MELLDRYLKEVAMWLPRKQAADIVGELRADIQSEVDERREALGRALSFEEQSAILTRWGNPMLVASRYHTAEPFIGPALLPTYYFALKVVGLVYLLPWLLVWIGVTLFVAPRGAGSLESLVVQALALFALITAGFAIVDRRQRRERTLETWTASELDPARKPRDWRQKSRATAIVDLVVTCVLLSWWTRLGWAQLGGLPAAVSIEPALRLTLPSGNLAVYVPVLALMLAGIGMAVADLLNPRWTPRRLGVQIGMDVTAVFVGLVLISQSILTVVPGADTDLAKSAALVEWANLSWRVTVGIVVAALAVRIVRNVRRIGSIITPPLAAAQ